MKRKDVVKTKGPIEKKSGFHYHPGSICRLDAEPSREEERQEIIDRAEAGQCPRCGGGMEERQDGKLWCPADGLVLTRELKEKYGK